MLIKTTYGYAKNNLSTLLDRVVYEQEIVVINRRGREDVAMIATSELECLLETAHLLRSPKNAERLFTALRRAEGKDYER
jgi:antitoxin YefM